MIESVLEFFGTTYLGRSMAVFLLSLFPMLGVSITIPLGAYLGLPPVWTAALSISGNLLPVPFIVVFIRRVFGWMRKKSRRLGRIADKFENNATLRGNKRLVRRGEFLGLLIFVALPIPFVPATGAWTGALIAGVLNMRLKRAFPAIGIGVLFGATIMTLVTYGFVAAVAG